MDDVELTLTIKASGDIEARRDDGSQTASRLNLDPLHARLLNLFDGWLREPRGLDRGELEVFGSFLHRAVFGGEVEGYFERARADAERFGGRLRLQMSFDSELPDLPGLPWEFLYSPDRPARPGYFLGTRKDLVVSRYIPLSTPTARTLLPKDPPLRMLVAVSRPEDLGPVLYQATVDTVREVERLAPDRMVVDVLEAATFEALDARLRSFRPHAFHFIGHARFDRERAQGEIALLKPGGKHADWYSDSVFAEAFEQAGAVPSLVLLQACNGASTDYRRNFAGLAPKLIRWGVQAVIAMQYEVSNLHAQYFGEAFYKALTGGEPIDDATQRGRWRLASLTSGATDSRAFGTPVLYMRSRDGLILPPR